MRRLFYFQAFILIIIIVFFPSCKKKVPGKNDDAEKLTIFYVNDVHGKIDNFAKVKYIIDQEELTTNVLVTSCGDMFSGNPIVDYHQEKGYPMIDLMNLIGVDIATLGNHEFDYGQELLKARIDQSEFDWLCANVDMGSSVIPDPPEYTTIEVGDLEITFLGFIQTSGKPGSLIPSTHPWRVDGITFWNTDDAINDFESIKEEEGSDLLIVLTHLGANYDFYLAESYPIMDMIIGGHSHSRIDTIINNIPIGQAGGNLNFLGKAMLEIKNKEIVSVEFDLIDLSIYANEDPEIKNIINDYNNRPEFYEVVAYNDNYLYSNFNLGCLYTDAIRIGLNTDISFQNPGGLRANIDEGDITVYEVYSVDPFNNGSCIYTMSVLEIKRFLQESGTGFYYSGVNINNDNGYIRIYDSQGQEYDNDAVLQVGINDYIPAVYDNLFPVTYVSGPGTTAEVLISFLRNSTENINYSACSNYFRFE